MVRLDNHSISFKLNVILQTGSKEKYQQHHNIDLEEEDVKLGNTNVQKVLFKLSLFIYTSETSLIYEITVNMYIKISLQ